MGVLASKLAAVSLLVSILTLSVLLLLLRFSSSGGIAHAAAAASTPTINNNNSIKMTKQESFTDSSGRLNLIGVVDNNGKIPVSITVGLYTIDKSGVANAMTDY